MFMYIIKGNKSWYIFIVFRENTYVKQLWICSSLKLWKMSNSVICKLLLFTVRMWLCYVGTLFDILLFFSGRSLTFTPISLSQSDRRLHFVLCSMLFIGGERLDHIFYWCSLCSYFLIVYVSSVINTNEIYAIRNSFEDRQSL